MRGLFLAFGFVLLNLVSPVDAAENCDAALVRATYSETSTFRSDWRLARYVSQESYDQLRKDFSGSTEIYGVPIGASYGEFQANYRRLEEAYNESLSIEQARTVLYTGLDPNAVNAYSACLQSKIYNTPGLHAAIIAATSSDITFKVKWFIAGDSTPLPVTWSPKTLTQVDGTPFPAKLPQGESIFTVARPKKDPVTLTVKGKGNSAEPLALYPLPPPTVRPPALLLGDFTRRPLARELTPCGAGTEKAEMQKGELWNLALLRTAVPDTKDVIPGYAHIHRTEHLSDGWRGNCRSWIGNTVPTRANPAYATIDLGRAYWIESVSFASDSTSGFNDRFIGDYSIEVQAAGGTWVKIIDGKNPNNNASTPVSVAVGQPARAIRISLLNGPNGLQPRVDEVEIWGKALSR